MTRTRFTGFLLLTVTGAVISNVLGGVVAELIHQVCVHASGDYGACVLVGKVQPFLVLHAQLLPVMLSAFGLFLISCRLGHAAGSAFPSIGVLIYSGVSWLMAEASIRVAPEESLAVVFSGALAAVYVNCRNIQK